MPQTVGHAASRECAIIDGGLAQRPAYKENAGMFHNIGVWEILLVLAIVLVLFGAARLPQMAQSLGRSLTSFKKGLRETADDVKDAIKEDATADADAADSDTTDKSDPKQTDKAETGKD
jgi:sec-independent protein translocase protein TatA